jgi:hypothetical protein
MSMASIATGLAMATVGVGAYATSGRTSKTALIPAAIGFPMAAAGVVEFVPILGRSAKVWTAALAFAAVGGASRGLPQLPALMRGDAVERPLAVIAQSATVGLAGSYLAYRVFAAFR